ncbi:MAG TPA: hypothetical protein VM487_13685 [Phycisphaerae bacterium]|nr:hypothetical protein [Phycisphaerae bacterium]
MNAAHSITHPLAAAILVLGCIIAHGADDVKRPTITNLTANKIHYLPGEEAVFTVSVKNDADAAAECAVSCWLVRRLNDREDVGTQGIALDLSASCRLAWCAGSMF